MLKKIEAWQADCEDADLKGLTRMGPEQKIAILKRIVTSRWRERIDVRGGEETDITIGQLVRDIKRWAAIKHTEGERKAPADNKDQMDIGNLYWDDDGEPEKNKVQYGGLGSLINSSDCQWYQGEDGAWEAYLPLNALGKGGGKGKPGYENRWYSQGGGKGQYSQYSQGQGLDIGQMPRQNAESNASLYSLGKGGAGQYPFAKPPLEYRTIADYPQFGTDKKNFAQW